MFVCILGIVSYGTGGGEEDGDVDDDDVVDIG